MKQHAMRGAEVLAQTTGLSEHVIRPALEHHERVDGTGYPFGKKLENLSQFGLISSVVDVYDAITSDRVYHKAMPAYQALGFLFDLGKKGHLEPSLVAHFIRCVGVYPVGSCVVLNTGEIGIVTRINRQELLRPKLMLVRDQERQVMSPTLDVDLAVQESRPERAIMTALDHTEVGIDPGMYLDPELQAA
jgi:HD-GYP domain-containing protein (c-di-GMP phosphodiesterase class II)